MMPSASVAPAVASEEQGKARRILFCAFPLYGHVLPLSRIAAAFCGCPGFDVQFMIVADRMTDANYEKLWKLVPTGCERVQIRVETETSMTELFDSIARNSNTWLQSVDNMLRLFCAGLTNGDQCRLACAGLREIQARRPALLVGDVAYFTDPPITKHLCDELGIRALAVVSPSRPDPIASGDLGVILKLAWNCAGTLGKVISAVGASTKAITRESGRPVPPKSVKPPLKIMPGSRALSGAPPGRTEL